MASQTSLPPSWMSEDGKSEVPPQVSSVSREDTLQAEYLAASATQPTFSVGTLGQATHGKSTLVRALTGVDTMKFKAEKSRNCTIKLGYASGKIFKCSSCVGPQAYRMYPPTRGVPPPCSSCGGPTVLVRHVSFVDCPGHGVLLPTMLPGASVMDGAIMIVAANQECPQPSTAAHLVVAEINNIKNLIVVQTKVDVSGRAEAQKNYNQIQEFVRHTVAEEAAVVPVAASLGYNVDVVTEMLANLPQPTHKLDAPLHMAIIRSFDVNKPGADFESLVGGIAGGAIKQGVLNVGDVIEVRPGHVVKHLASGRVYFTPLITRVTSLKSESTSLQRAFPGGLIAVGTTVDPSFTRGDKLAGSVIGSPGSLPPVYTNLVVKVTYLRGTKSLSSGEGVALAIGAEVTVCRVDAFLGDKSKRTCTVRLLLSSPVCTALDGVRTSVLRKEDSHWKLVGSGDLVAGTEAELRTVIERDESVATTSSV